MQINTLGTEWRICTRLVIEGVGFRGVAFSAVLRFWMGMGTGPWLFRYASTRGQAVGHKADIGGPHSHDTHEWIIPLSLVVTASRRLRVSQLTRWEARNIVQRGLSNANIEIFEILCMFRRRCKHREMPAFAPESPSDEIVLCDPSDFQPSPGRS